MLRPLLALIAVAVLCPAASAQFPAIRHKIESSDYQSVVATITYEIHTTKFAVSRWMAYLPEPPDLPSQKVIRIAADPVGTVVAEKSGLARKVRFIDFVVRDPMPGGRLALRLEVEATLRKRSLVPLIEGERPPQVEPLTPAERKYYTSATPQADYDAKPLRDWLDRKDLLARSGEQPLELAARVLTVLRSDFLYRYDPEEEKRASLVCARRYADCAGLSHLLVAAMRANGVPARSLVGRFARPRRDRSRPTDIGYDQPHVRAEVYVANLGWVPIDPADAQAGRRRPVTDFIGADPGNLLVLHVDGDLRLPFPDRERTVDLLQISPYYWAFGKGPFDGAFGPTGWELKAKLLVKQ